jgi:fumarate hydratase class I
MDSYVKSFMENGGSFITLAKGNRSRQVRLGFSCLVFVSAGLLDKAQRNGASLKSFFVFVIDHILPFRQVTNACKEHGGFYLGSIGGPAAILAQNCIKKVEVKEYEELGMEAVWQIEVSGAARRNSEPWRPQYFTLNSHTPPALSRPLVQVKDFPAFIVVDNKGNDFFQKWQV